MVFLFNELVVFYQWDFAKVLELLPYSKEELVKVGASSNFS
jgi:hypothetical protein